VYAALACSESVKIATRVKAGMARVSASGQPWVSRKGNLVSSVGRPKLDPAMRREIAKRLAAGDTAYRIAKDMMISKNTVAKYERRDG